MFHILLNFDLLHVFCWFHIRNWFQIRIYMVSRFGNNNSTLSFKFSKLLFSFTVYCL